MTGLVKICGLKEIDHVVASIQAGADLIGFNFASSKRRIDPDLAAEAAAVARASNPAIRVCGLFVDARPQEIERIRNTVGFDLLQLHGEGALDVVAEIGMPAILPVRVEPGVDSETVIEQAIRALEGPAEFIMIDAFHPTLHGGTGLKADWEIAANVARHVPLMLAGGLNPDNVSDAIRTVAPAIVDVASGVESNGAKDPEKIRMFIEASRRSFAQSISSGTSSQDAP